MQSKNIPAPLRGLEPDSWARTTIIERLPEIAGRILQENQFPAGVNLELKILVEEIPHATIRPVKGHHAPDFSAWRGYTAGYLDLNWLEVPWFFAEHYFYRRVMEAVRYFEGGVDPFQGQKAAGYRKSARDTVEYSEKLTGWLEPDRDPGEVLSEAVFFALWGNQADYSLWPADGENSPEHDDPGSAREHILADDSRRLIAYLKGLDSPGRIDFMLDNAGFELVTDLGLIDLILSRGLAKSVLLHVKAHPTFVSDVIPADVRSAVDWLLHGETDPVRAFGSRLNTYLERGQVSIREDFFWNSPLAMWKLPRSMNKMLAGADLLISKGDANYRRLAGDRRWDFTMPFSDVVDYLPVPLAAFRTLKAELAVGLSPEALRKAEASDPEWMTNGRWGVVQFAPSW